VNVMTDKNELIAQLQRIAAELGTKSVPRHEFLRRVRMSERRVSRLFGSYTDLVKAAGLEPLAFPTADVPMYSDQEMLEELVRVLRLPDARLTRIFFERNATISPSAIERRFGGWVGALRASQKLLDSLHDADLLRRLAEYVDAAPTTAFRTKDAGYRDDVGAAPQPDDQHVGEEAPHARIESANLYGDFINFRGLQHAPVNEQGVVFLFGMICRELGYVVEIVKQGFPDCEAKRRVRGKPGMWQRVRIEFEFQSRTFRAHGHDPDQCDLIVCWEDNWPDCPIEVFELRAAVRNLSSKLPTDGSSDKGG